MKTLLLNPLSFEKFGGGAGSRYQATREITSFRYPVWLAYPAVLKNIKKGATVEQALAFMKDCKRLGIAVHGDFQMGHPGESHETIERTIQFAMKLDPQTMQVSISHPYPGTEFFRYLRERGYLVTTDMTDECGHQLPNIQYPGLSRKEIVEAVENFYSRYYFRPRIIFRILRQAIFDARECRRLFTEAKEFFELRAKRKSFVDPRAASRLVPS